MLNLSLGDVMFVSIKNYILYIIYIYIYIILYSIYIELYSVINTYKIISNLPD